MCFYYDGDVETIRHSETLRVSMKDRRCAVDFCNRIIKKGDIYNNHDGLNTEVAYSYGICCECDYLRNEIVKQEMDSGCKWNEAWCPLEELMSEVKERGIVRESYEWCQQRLRELKPPRKKWTRRNVKVKHDTAVASAKHEDHSAASV